MPFIKRFTLAFCLSVLTLSSFGAPVVAAPSESHVFNLYIRGFRAGTISTAVRKTKTGYALAGAVQPTRFLRRLRDVGYKGTASGTYKGNKYRPRKYTGNIKTGSRTSVVKMRWRNGRPIVDSYEPSREKRSYDINPSAQTGTIDLLSALHSVFEDSARADLCNRTLPMFDGRRRSKLTLSKPKMTEEGATCAGTYTRVAGFSPADLKKRVNFPFTLVYQLQDDETFRLMSFHTQTTFGKASAVRR